MFVLDVSAALYCGSSGLKIWLGLDSRKHLVRKKKGLVQYSVRAAKRP